MCVIIILYCSHRQLFPGLKIAKQNEEMKQNAMNWNDWKKSGINGLLPAFFHLLNFHFRGLKNVKQNAVNQLMVGTVIKITY